MLILVSLCVFESIRISNSTKRIYIEQRKRTQGLWTLWDLWNGDRFGKGFCVLFSLTVTVIIESLPCPRLKWHLSIQVSQIWSHRSLICCSNSKKKSLYNRGRWGNKPFSAVSFSDRSYRINSPNNIICFIQDRRIPEEYLEPSRTSTMELVYEDN